MQTDRSSSYGSNSDTALPDQAFGVPLTRLKRWLKSLRVSRKISLGYAIALGVAIAGTATGVALGDRYQRRAQAKEAHVQAEIKILHRLQTSLLRARNRQQQLIPLVGDPEQFRQQYARLRMDAAAVRSYWLELELFLAQAAPNSNGNDQRTLGFMERNQALLEEYFKQLDQRVSRLNLGRSPSADAVRAAQQELLDFTNSPIALQIDQLSNAMIGLESLSDDENAEVSQAQFTADDLRLKIIVLSMALSAAIAAILAVLISRLITRPLDGVTKVARQATQDSNFELRAPVTTDDEVGALANSLNQLIQRVGELLEEQRATVAQQLVQTEKMSSLGQMVAGVAHEINNPVNFIYGNLTHASQYIDDLFELLDIYKAELTPVPAAVQAKETAIEFDFLKDDLPKLLQSMQVGADRARQIV
ncbi:MAG TPA: HAMP domain-containing protein, partial [Chroococcidiopsis sp.]